MTIEDLDNKLVEVGTTQATYVQLKTGGQLFKINFISKKEFHLKKGTMGNLQYYEDHPLLMDYNENLESTYIGSKFENAEFIASEIRNVIEDATSSWRDWRTYLVNRNSDYGYQIFMNNLKTGTGKILEASTTITKLVVAKLNQYSIETTTLDAKALEPKKHKLILIGDNYVIAQDFKLEEE